MYCRGLDTHGGFVSAESLMSHTFLNLCKMPLLLSKNVQKTPRTCTL